MTAGSGRRHDGTGPELRPRWSPEFARRQRRRSLWAGVGAIGMGLFVLVLGVDSVRTGKWVAFGRVGNEVDLPGAVVILMALFLLFLGGSIIWRSARSA